MIEFGCVNSRMLWFEFRFAKIMVCAIVYDSTEGGDEGREKFRNSEKIRKREELKGRKLTTVQKEN